MTLLADFTAKKEELAAKRIAVKGLYEQADKETDDTKRADLYSSIKTGNTELAALVDAIEPLAEMVTADEQNKAALKAMKQPGQRQIDPDKEADPVDRGSFSDEIFTTGHKSIGSALRATMESRGIKNFRNFRGDLDGDLAIKTLITSADLTPLEDRQAVIQPSAQEERTVADLMLAGTTTAQKITYFVETTFTNSAAEVGEGLEKPESAIDFTLREDNVRKIATWVPVTDEMMEDVPTFESYLRGRLGFMIKQREELQLLRGAGTGVTIEGLYNRTGVQTVTGYGMSTIDSILAGIVEIQKDAFVEPTAIVIHPNDWFNVRTSKDTTGNYLLGPATLDPDAARPWGLRVRVTTNALENTALVGAYNQAQVFRRTGISIAISSENQDFFIYNKLAVRAEERIALAVYRPAAFCKVEAIVTGS